MEVRTELGAFAYGERGVMICILVSKETATARAEHLQLPLFLYYKPLKSKLKTWATRHLVILKTCDTILSS